MKILVSWIAAMHDFLKEENSKGNKINYDGPTFNFHREFYNHDEHIILCQGDGVEKNIRAELLRTELTKEYENRKITVVYLNVLDVIDIVEIKSKVEAFLLRFHQDNKIDIFFSPGTSAMQIAWYLINETQILNTNLYQVRPKSYSKTGKSELLEIKVLRSNIPVGSIIKEENTVKHVENYLITGSLKPIYERADMIGNADQVTTLIYGESGTGKEHLARYIHEKSTRKNMPFVAVNCSAFSDNLLESRLFGHKKGSFTGAISDHKGFFEEAKGGVIFLDEIGDISSYMQQSLLRVIQEKKIIAIGESKEKKIDVRIIAATNKDLPAMCAEGKFRWDLYYRLAVTELTLPPVRERKEIERRELIDFFLASKKKMFKRESKIVFEKEAEKRIFEYSFPGNVREIENLIESLYVFNDKNISLDALPARLLNPADENRLDLKTVEKLHIIKVLKLTKSKQQAAKILGCVINTLEKKIKDYNIEN